MDERIKTIAEHYGYERQKMKLVEEAGELLQALGKLDEAGEGFPYLKAKDHLLEEIADVAIMIEQIVYLLCGEDRASAKREDKLNRQIRRIEKAYE